jgi:hypothetical protein
LTPREIPVFSGFGVKLVARASKSGLIVCVSDSSTSSAGQQLDNLVKIFDIDKPEKNSGFPSLVRTTRISSGGSGGLNHPTALAVDEDLNLVAVGFSNGSLILIRGDLR